MKSGHKDGDAPGAAFMPSSLTSVMILVVTIHLPTRALQRRGARALRAVRPAQSVGADAERLLLVLFFVLFAIGSVLAITQIVDSGSLFAAT